MIVRDDCESSRRSTASYRMEAVTMAVTILLLFPVCRPTLSARHAPHASETTAAYVLLRCYVLHSLSPSPANRQSHLSVQALDADIIIKRTKRHLDELEVSAPPQNPNVTCLIVFQRSNYAEPSASLGGDDDDNDDDRSAIKSAKGRARQTISDKRNLSTPGAKKKKSTMNIRTAVLYRKNLATLIEESVRPVDLSDLPLSVTNVHRALTDFRPPPRPI